MRRIVLVALLVFGLIFGDIAAAQEPALELDVVEAAPGVSFEVRGFGHTECVEFTEGRVFIFFDATLIGTPEADQAGDFVVQVTLPDTIEDPPADQPFHTVASSCHNEPPPDSFLLPPRPVAVSSIFVESGSIAEEPEPDILVFTQTSATGAINTGVPGERGNAVGVIDPPACDSVFIFFGGERVAQAVGHPAGDLGEKPSFSGGTFNIPPDARSGEHTVTASCDPSGDPAQATSTFLVLGAAATGNRSAFVSSLRDAREAFDDTGQILRNLLLTLLLILLIIFPAQLFNSTLEEHYDEVRRWFRFGRQQRERPPAGPGRRWLMFGIFAILGAIAYGFLDPGFGINTYSLILAIGILAAIFVATMAYDFTSAFYLNRKYSAGGRLKVLPGTLLVAVVCVVISRLTNFLPGYFYGFLAGFAFQREFSKDEEGRSTGISATIALVVALAAWLAWIPVKDAVIDSDPSAILLVVEAVLVATFVAGLEGLVFGLIPMRFLDGEKLFTWNKPLWAIFFGIGVFGFVHVIVNANSAGPEEASVYSTIALFLGFGLVSVAFWGFFRFRRAPAATPAGAPPAPPPNAPVPARPGPAPAPPAERARAEPEEETEDELPEPPFPAKIARKPRAGGPRAKKGGQRKRATPKPKPRR